MVEEDVWYTRKPQKGLSFNETNGDTREAQIRKKKRYYDKKEVCVVSDNVLAEISMQPGQMKNGSDITYIPYKQKNLYLSAICDLFNNEIIAFHLSTRNDLQLVIDTLEKARKVHKQKVYPP
ncbi:hypothetical protein P7H16_18930 [Paenibacillus larvae]|nr:hypothetical protein [Paenibacillus larvae]